MVDLYPYDGPYYRQGVADVVRRVCLRAIEDFYLIESSEAEVVACIDNVVFGGGLDHLGSELTDWHRVLALRLVLFDRHFPLVSDWSRRLFGDEPDERSLDRRPPGYVGDGDFLDMQAVLSPVLADIAALYVSPIIWQPTEILGLRLHARDGDPERERRGD